MQPYGVLTPWDIVYLIYALYCKSAQVCAEQTVGWIRHIKMINSLLTWDVGAQLYTQQAHEGAHEYEMRFSNKQKVSDLNATLTVSVRKKWVKLGSVLEPLGVIPSQSWSLIRSLK